MLDGHTAYKEELVIVLTEFQYFRGGKNAFRKLKRSRTNLLTDSEESAYATPTRNHWKESLRKRKRVSSKPKNESFLKW